MKKELRHLIMVKVDNRPGVLSRITGLFTRRGYNIESLVTGMTASRDIYHITMTMLGSDDEVALLARQLERCMEVLEVKCDSDEGSRFVSRELILARIPCESPARRLEIMNVCSLTGASVAAAGENSVVVELTGEEEAVQTALHAFECFGKAELIHSGTVGIDVK